LHEVAVLDSAGQNVPGDVELTTAHVLDGSGNVVMRWRPAAELERGARYEVTLTVQGSPLGWEMAGCPQRPGFSTGVIFTVATSEPEPPRIELEVDMSHSWYSTDRLVACGAGDWDAQCGDVNPDLCCVRTNSETRWIEASFVLRGLLPPPFYSGVIVEFIMPGEPRRPRPPWTNLEADRQYKTRHDGWPSVTSPDGESPCVEIRFHNLMNGDEGAALATSRACFELDRLVLVPEPPPMSECNQTSCEPYAPPGDDVAEVVETDITEEERTADPDPERGTSGCESGPSGTAALVLGAALSATRRRRWVRGS
jgi:hypothetical protein